MDAAGRAVLLMGWVVERAEVMGQEHRVLNSFGSKRRGALFWGTCALRRVGTSSGWCTGTWMMVPGSWLMASPPAKPNPQTLKGLCHGSLSHLLLSPGNIHPGLMGRGAPHPASLGDAMARFRSISELDESLVG